MSIPIADDVLYDLAKDRLADQMQRIDTLDAKAATVYTFASGILAFFAATFSLAKPPAGGISRGSFYVLIATSILFYLVTLIAAFKAYNIGQWSQRPDLGEIETFCQTNTTEVMHVWVARQCIISVNENDPFLLHKARWLHTALFTLPFEAGLLVIASVISLLTQRP